MPPVTRTAFRIYIAAMLLSPVVGYFEPGEIPPVPPEATPILLAVVLLFVLPFFGVIALIIYKAYRGRNWARLVLAVFTACGAVLYIEHVLALFAASPVVAIIQASLAIVEVVAVAFLFSGPSNAWYRAQATQVDQAAA
jgi:hypothetical protein